ncbi:MAG: DUF5131 family protein [Acidobacteriota bacterium]
MSDLRPVSRSQWPRLATGISWAHASWNPWTGCAKVSEGCRHCYAETFAKNRQGRDIWGPNKPRPRTRDWSKIRKLRWMARDPEARQFLGLEPGERLRVFVASMADWAEGREDQRPIVADMWDVIREAYELDFLMLSKRLQNVPGLLPPDWAEGWPHVWMGASIESGLDTHIDAHLGEPVIARARELLKVPAVCHWVSYEPALGPLASELEPFLRGHHGWRCQVCLRGTWEPDFLGLANPSSPAVCPSCPERVELGAGFARGVSWVVYGGETGPGRRADEDQWAWDMLGLCDGVNLSGWYKQKSAARPGKVPAHFEGFQRLPYLDREVWS